MNEQPQAIAKKRVVEETAIRTTVRRDIDAGGGILVDVYQPAAVSDRAVLIVSGYRDQGFQSFLGCRFKEMGWTVSWAELIAASGLTAVTYSAPDPPRVDDLLQRIRDGVVSGIDAERIGVLASSGHGPMAMWLLRRDAPVAVRCAALLYPFTIDVDGATDVAAGAKLFGFFNPGVENIRDDVPLFLARAGGDETQGLNAALDAFVTHALRRDMPLTLVNYAGAPHAFDLFVDADRTRQIIRQVLAFFAAAL